MQYFTGHIPAQKVLQGAVVTIGNFDGLHLGHQELIKQTKIMAARLKVPAAVYTFSPHPSQLLLQKPPKMLMTDIQKRRWLAQLGLDGAIFEPFTPAFSRISAQDFLQKILVDGLGVSGVVVGENFNFGYMGTGNSVFLQESLSLQGVKVQIVSPVLVDGQVCSSSAVRQLVLSGQVDAAAALLGRSYLLEGVVVHGDGRGKTIGFPTVNLKTEQELLPATGVYATLVKLPGHEKPMLGATNVGYRPTFNDDNQIHIETHILDFDRTIYEQPIELAFVKKIRDELKFHTVDKLKSQIEKDLIKVWQVLSISPIDRNK